MGFNRELVKKKLLERKKELEYELQRLAENRSSGKSQGVQDPIDQATQSELEDLNITLEENQREEYDRIIHALDMIAEGTYGACNDCGEAISEKRLSLYPNATRCIACQERYEAE